MVAMLTEGLPTSILLQSVVPQALVVFIVVVAFTLPALLQRFSSGILRCRTGEITPEAIADHEPSEEHPGPEILCRRIVERVEQIRRVLLENPSEIEVEMCSIGYRACVEDMGVLIDLVEAELEVSGPIRRWRLRAWRRRAAEAIFHMHEAFPTGSLHPLYHKDA